MNGMIGCYGLIGIAIFIIGLAFWSRRQRRGVSDFYGKYSFTTVANPPESVRAAIGVLEPLCFSSTVKPDRGDAVPFYWWEWSSTSMISTGTGVQSSMSCFLAISFSPNTVSSEFEHRVIAEKEAKRPALKWLKDIFALNTQKPIRIEKLSDGSFVVFWQIVQRPEVMEHKIAWLRQNLTA